MISLTLQTRCCSTRVLDYRKLNSCASAESRTVPLLCHFCANFRERADSGKNKGLHFRAGLSFLLDFLVALQDSNLRPTDQEYVRGSALTPSGPESSSEYHIKQQFSRPHSAEAADHNASPNSRGTVVICTANTGHLRHCGPLWQASA